MNNTFLLHGLNGYDISVVSNVRQEHSGILLCLHGFGGGGRSPAVEALTEALDTDGIGVVTFTWPAHGDSPAAGSDLTVENCLRDLAAVMTYIHHTWPQSVSCFVTSFGGYLAALYRSGHPEAFHKLILRSPTLNMPQTFIYFFFRGGPGAFSRRGTHEHGLRSPDGVNRFVLRKSASE